MYIQVRPTTAGDRRARTVLDAPLCPCHGGSWRLGQTADGRKPLKESDVSVTGTGPTKAIARRVRIAVMNLSRSRDAVLYNAAQRIANGDVPIRFLEEIRPKDARDLLAKEGKTDAEIKALLKTHRLVRAEAFGQQPIPKGARAFEENGVIYVPMDADVADLMLDLPHEVNHAMNPVKADQRRDPGGWLWEKFKGEVRANYVVNFRTVTAKSPDYGMSYRLQRSIEHAHDQFQARGFTTMPGWDPQFVIRMRSWEPDGNLDNSA